MERHTYQIQADAQDSHWWYQGRRQILDRFLQGLDPPLPPIARILDVGSGTGSNGAVLRRYGDAIGVDFEPLALSLSESMDSGHVYRVCADATRLPFADGSFDLVTCLDLLEHLEDDQTGARELARVVRPGGAVVSFVPAFRALWGFQDDISHHKRRYRKRQFVELFESARLDVVRATYFNTMLFAPIFVTRKLMQFHRPKRIESENQIGGPIAQRLLGKIFAAEAPLLERVDLPFGVSLAVVARRAR